MAHSFKLVAARTALVAFAMVMCVGKPIAAEEPEPGRHAVRAFLGFMSSDNESKLGDDDGAGMLIAAYEYRPNRHFAVGGEFQVIAHSYRPSATPAGFFTDPDRDSDVDSGGFAGTVRGFVPLGSVDMYGGGGLGLYYSQLAITGTTNGVDGIFYETDSGFGYFAMVGADIALARQHRLTVEFRKLWLKADFDKLGGGEVDIGGDILALGYQYRF